jgi:hypothetical protein
MKHFQSLSAVGLMLVAAASSQAVVYQIDVSPPSGFARNLGANTYTQDHAVGLGARNENAQPASLASGNEVGTGVTYDTVTKTLAFRIAYGSDFGFVDLNANISDAHIHGATGSTVNFPAVNGNGGVLTGIMTNHTAGSSGRTGSFNGTRVLTAAQETLLIDNKMYFNLHTASFAPAGEIRGQLVIVPEPTTLAAVASLGLLGLRRRR